MTNAELASLIVSAIGAITGILAFVRSGRAEKTANSIALRNHLAQQLQPYREKYNKTRTWFANWQDAIGSGAEEAYDNVIHAVDRFDKGDNSGRPLRHILHDISEGFYEVVKKRQNPSMFLSISRDLIQFPWERINELDSPEDKTFACLRLSSSERKNLFRLLIQFDSRLSDESAAWSAVEAASQRSFLMISRGKEQVAIALKEMDAALTESKDAALDLEPENEFWAELLHLRNALDFFNEFDAIDQFLGMDIQSTKRSRIIVSALVLLALTEGVGISRNAWGIPAEE